MPSAIMTPPLFSGSPEKAIWIFTDGACAGNPGPGGWGALIRYPERMARLAGYEAHTTNNRMELTAPIKALQTLLDQSISLPITVVSDSQYVVKGITEWIHGWRRNHWKTSTRKDVENRDLWETLWTVATRVPTLSWQWVRGHNGHPENEEADQLAKSALLAKSNCFETHAI